jgi:hypothetical protein
MRRLAGVGVLFLALTFPVFSSMMGPEEKTCPLCQETFTAVMAVSGTSLGMRSDLKQLGPIIQPWPVAQCPKCRFVLYDKLDDQEISKEDIERLHVIVASEDWAAISAEAPPHFFFARELEALDKPPLVLSVLYLGSSWQAERKSEPGLERREGWIAKGLEESYRCLRQVELEKQSTTNRLWAAYMGVELPRRLGLFDEAEKGVAAFERTVADLRKIDPDQLDERMGGLGHFVERQKGWIEGKEKKAFILVPDPKSDPERYKAIAEREGEAP